ncbi:MAG: O-antigen ligase family protein [Lachnospiraceae bacterium]|nr:O-antigen ligase family protein [Lachnospiraceae bacterium]
MRVLYQVQKPSPISKVLFFYMLTIASIGIGYAEHRFNKEILVYLMLFYCGINICLSALRTEAPLFLRVFYNLTGEHEADYFTRRVVGTMGNPNATLCVMNVLFMGVVLFIMNKEIKIDGIAKTMAIMGSPLIMNLFVNSRGELIITIFLEIVLLGVIIRRRRYSFNGMVVILVCVLLAAGVIVFAYTCLAPKYETVAYGLNRLVRMYADNERFTDADSVIRRPFLFVGSFLTRFMVSPIWGSGFSAVNSLDYARSVDSYHNDWFRILASTGLIGLALWMRMISIIVKNCGYFFILPFIITASTNTFIESYMAMSVYFICIASTIHAKELSLVRDEKRWPYI